MRDWPSNGRLGILYNWFIYLSRPSAALNFNGIGKGRIINKDKDNIAEDKG